jgi:hypothetical protein
VRLLVVSQMNCWIRKLWAQCTSTPSSPPSTALRPAWANASTTSAISSLVIEWDVMPVTGLTRISDADQGCDHGGPW